jgi:hypothetical protein
LTSSKRIRSRLLEGSILTNSGQDYRRALALLRRGLADSATSGFPNKFEDHALVTRSWNALGHLTRELGGDPRWSASFHRKSSEIWKRVGNPWEASLALFSAAHSMQSEYPNTALRLIELGRNTTSSRPDATIESYAETRIAQVLESHDANALAAKHYIRKVVPVCEWNDVRPAWAAISLIAAAKSIPKLGTLS